MDRVKLGAGEGVPGMGYPRAPLQQTGRDSGSRAGGEVCSSEGTAGGIVCAYGKMGRPSVYSEPSGVCLMLFFVGENLAVLGPVVVRRITEMEGKRYLFELDSDKDQAGDPLRALYQSGQLPVYRLLSGYRRLSRREGISSVDRRDRGGIADGSPSQYLLS